MDDQRSDDQINQQAERELRLRDVLSELTGERSRLSGKERSVLRYFAFEHLRPPLRGVSVRFALLAVETATAMPGHPETYAALRKLLEAKDCAVRAVLP